MGNSISGVAEEVFTESVTQTIKGKKLTRHWSKEKPAYLVRSEALNRAECGGRGEEEGCEGHD